MAERIVTENPVDLKRYGLAPPTIELIAADEHGKPPVRGDGLPRALQRVLLVDPTDEPERVAEQLGRMRAVGATGLAVRFVHHSAQHYCEQLAALRALADTDS